MRDHDLVVRINLCQLNLCQNTRIPVDRLEMKRKELEWALGDVRPFQRPNIQLEQYTTCAEIAGVCACAAHKCE
jgi:hypothetical protein